MANRLASSTSPYLLQHAENPVDWWPWEDEAFAEARRRNVPVLLSIGYAACHWCHVMAHESFEDEATADLVNRNFVAVKVDREERPDVDAIYMEVTQAMTGHGGWPVTCFLTPDGAPFHCGTYYPPTARPGMPSFPQLLAAVSEAWNDNGDEVRAAAARVVEELTAQSKPFPESAVDESVLAAAITSLERDFDQHRGGFGDAPKFPPSMQLEAMLRHHERTGSRSALHMAEVTCESMARGGIYDQLGGGFARYSVDGGWVVPHFEKMLYDNALLLRVYTHLARLTGSPTAARVAAETAEFLIRDLGTSEGGFAASLDADTDGVEGLTYSWTPEQLTEVLGPDDGAWAAQLFAVTPAGTFEHGTSVLQLLTDPLDRSHFADVRARLFEARNARPQPGRDDKVVTEWNGMTITALTEAGVVLERPEWVAAASRAMDLLLTLHVVDGRPRRSSRDGVVGAAGGVLADSAWLVEGLLALYQAGDGPGRLSAAQELLDSALARFANPDHPGAWFDTADDAEPLFRRPSDSTDGATPSGAAALANALVAASALTGVPRYRDAAQAAITRAGVLPVRAPRAAGHWLTAAEALAHGPVQVAVIGDGPAATELLATARRRAPGGAVVLGGPPGSAEPLLADRGLIDGSAAAYVCRGFVCDRPVGTPSDLEAQLTRSL